MGRREPAFGRFLDQGAQLAEAAVLPTRDAILAAYEADTLTDLIFDRFISDADDPLLVACVALHNDGNIDLLSLRNGSKFRTIEGPLFFRGQRFFCLAIPMLVATTVDMMSFVDALVKKGGEDLSANDPNAAFREWCKVDLGRARAVVDAAKAGDLQAAQFVTFALTAGNMASEAMRFVSDSASNLRIFGVVALGRMKYASGSEVYEALQSLLHALDGEPDDALTANVLLASLGAAEKGDLIQTDDVERTIDRVCEVAGAGTVHCCATALCQHGGRLSERATLKLLDVLYAVDPSHHGTINQIDLALHVLLGTPYADQAIAFTKRLLISSGGSLQLSEFESFSHALVGSVERLRRVVVDWLLDGNQTLCHGLDVLLRQPGHRDVPLDVSLEIEQLKPIQQIFIARKAIGYFFLRPVLAASVVVSVLRVCDDQTSERACEVLFDPLLISYGGAVVDYLKSIDPVDKGSSRVQDALKIADEYLQGLKSVGLISELHPSERERQLEYFRFIDEMQQAHDKAMAQSVLLNLVHRSVILYGTRSLTYVGMSSDDRHPVEMELKPHEVSMELPRMDLIDPVGLDYILRTFRVERLNS